MDLEEYPGFGLNSKDEITKENIIKKSRALIKKILSENPENIVIVGESLGSGVATQMAKEFNINNLVLITPYSKLSDVAQSKFWFLPAKVLLKDDYDNIENMKGYKGKSVIIMAQNDITIPNNITLKLTEAIKTKPLIIKGAGHNDWFNYITEEQMVNLDLLFE